MIVSKAGHRGSPARVDIAPALGVKEIETLAPYCRRRYLGQVAVEKTGGVMKTGQGRAQCPAPAPVACSRPISAPALFVSILRE